MSRFNFSAVPSGFGFTEFNGETLFLGDYGNAGGNGTPFLEVFKTDGTAAGTTASLVDGLGGAAYPGGLWVLGNTLLTSGPTAQRPPGIWASTDGSNFTQIESGVGTSNLVVSNGIGFFQAYDGNQANAGLWRTDGTAAGTYSITPSGVSLDPADISSVAGGRTVFINQTNTDGSGPLWVTDGTEAGTHALVDAALGGDVRFGGATTNGHAIFTATDAANNISVWSTDGTTAGTAEILVSGPANAAIRTPNGYLAAGGKVFFDSGYGLFATDGTKAGTVALTNGGQGTEGAVASGDKVFFLQPEPSAGNSSLQALFVTDGTVKGTMQLTVAGLQVPQGSLTAVDGGIVFEGTDSAGKQALFTSDGTSAGSRELVLPAGIPIDASTFIGAEPPATVTGGVVTLGGGAQFYQAAAGTTVSAGGGADTVLASAGQVTVGGSSGSLLFIGGTGASSVAGGSGSATIFGGSGGGSFVGGSAGHNIFISQGAASANTTLTGGGAGDEMFVAAGPTTVNGGSGGGDSIVGGSGAMVVNAQKGDAVFGGSGALTVAGSSSGADSIVGGTGALTVTGNGGNMLVVAGTGGSAINTGNGASLIFATSGSTIVTGGAGSLQAVLGSGTAAVTEGSGPGVYDVIKGAAGGTDVLNGFKPSTDRIDLFGYAAGDVHVTTGGGSTLLSLADGTRITLVGVTDPGGSIIG